jgi:hypothetical protein
VQFIRKAKKEIREDRGKLKKIDPKQKRKKRRRGDDTDSEEEE